MSCARLHQFPPRFEADEVSRSLNRVLRAFERSEHSYRVLAEFFSFVYKVLKRYHDVTKPVPSFSVVETVEWLLKEFESRYGPVDEYVDGPFFFETFVRYASLKPLDVVEVMTGLHALMSCYRSWLYEGYDVAKLLHVDLELARKKAVASLAAYERRKQ